LINLFKALWPNAEGLLVERRHFLKACFTGVAAATSPGLASSAVSTTSHTPIAEHHVKDYLSKIKNFNQHFDDDIILSPEDFVLLKSATKRLKRLQRYVGYANFSLISFDLARYYGRNYSAIGAFSKAEIDFIERIFYTNASDYGFLGEKVLPTLTAGTKRKDTVKIAGSGHYLFKGKSEQFYKKVVKDLGNSIILTSGVRGIVKQMHLFLNKAVESKGNLSMASRSLAPPGHSFHGVGDFDVGKRGFGRRNFTEAFAKTDEFKRLRDLGYIGIRYHEKNPFGVRFEPWHVKVV
jgi:hypothetical protein